MVGGLVESRGSLTVIVAEKRSWVGSAKTHAVVVKLESDNPSDSGRSAPGKSTQ